MAKELPYFKFFCSEWNDGDITLEDMETQGVFINICSYYWSNNCILEYSKLKKRFRDYTSNIKLLVTDSEIIKINDGFVVINFLDEQLKERSKLATQNRLNAQKRWKAKQKKCENDASALNSQCESDAIEIRKEEIRKEEIRKLNEDTNIIYSLYPSKCVVKHSSTGKSKDKNHKQIKGLLKTNTVGELKSIIERYVTECKKDQTFMKNFTTFLNNLPDYDTQSTQKEKKVPYMPFKDLYDDHE